MIRVHFLFVHCLAVIVLISGASRGVCIGAEEGLPPLDRSIPPLMESIRFPEEIRLCGIKVPLEIPEVRQSLEREMLLAVWDRPQVILWIMRSGRYFPHIEKILTQENLPLDLKYVPVIESGLRPHSGSSKGAVGYWQFIKTTGQKYGLRIDDQIDDRRNIFKSTLAACHYLKKLNTEFESYLLALSAYNMGEYGLHGEIDAQENKDYFSLYLPLETQRYVFKIIVAKMILENPEKYGFSLDKSHLYPEFQFSKINLNMESKTPLVIIAKAAGIPFKTLKDMNPEIRGYTLAPGEMSVLVPQGREQGFKEKFIEIYQGWEKSHKTQSHEVKPGETLTSIARHYKISLAYLLRLNNFDFDKVIHPGERVLIK